VPRSPATKRLEGLGGPLVGEVLQPSLQEVMQKDHLVRSLGQVVGQEVQELDHTATKVPLP